MQRMLLTLLVFMAVVPAAVAADTVSPADRRLRVSGVFAGTAGGLGTEAAFGGAVGYRFSPRLSVEVELTGIPEADPEEFHRTEPLDVGLVLPPIGLPIPRLSFATLVPIESNALLATANLRREFVADSERVRPYLSGGFGIAHTRTKFRFLTSTVQLLPGVPSPPPVVQAPRARFETDSDTDLTVTLGAGVGVRLVGALFLDLDARYYRLMEPGRSVGRFGSGLSYRF